MTVLVVLTQALESGDPLARRLSAEGQQVAHWPLVRLVPAATEALLPVLERLADFDLILIPSPSAVRLVAQRMKESGIAWPPDSRAGLVGPGSVEAFRDCFGDGPAVLTPAEPPHDASHLVEMLDAVQVVPPEGGIAAKRMLGAESVPAVSAGAGVPGPPGFRAGPGGFRAGPGGACSGLRVLVLNRPDGRTAWLDSLRRKAQSVEVIAAYRAEALESGPSPDLMSQLERLQGAAGAVIWVIGSASQVDTLLRALPAGWAGWAQRQPVVVPHAAVAAHARSRGFANAQAYDDRQDLVQRLQYLRNTSGQAPVDLPTVMPTTRKFQS